MKRLLSTSWWMLALRGLAAIVFGILALAWPGATLLALVWLIAVYAIAVGIIFAVLGLRLRSVPPSERLAGA